VARQHFLTQQSLKEQMLCSNLLLDEMSQQELLLLIRYNSERPLIIGTDSLGFLSEIAVANAVDFLKKMFYQQVFFFSESDSTC
jgi:hypothetical protein